MFTFLFNKGAKVETSFLYCATYRSHIDIAKMLLDNGADINGTSDFNPLYEAANGNKSDFVKFLLDNGADINGLDGYYPLNVALSEGYRHVIVETLIERGADVNFRDKNGKTPLYHCRYPKDAYILLSTGLVKNESDFQSDEIKQDPLVRFAIGIARLKQGNYQDAIHYFEEACNKTVLDFRSASYLISTKLLLSENREDLYQEITKMTARNPDDKFPFFLKAMFCYHTSLLDESLNIIDTKLEPQKHKGVYALKAMIMMLMGKTEDAIKSSNLFVNEPSVTDYDLFIKYISALVNRNTGQLKTAYNILKNVVNIDPNLVEATLHMAELELSVGSRVVAKESLSKVETLAPILFRSEYNKFVDLGDRISTMEYMDAENKTMAKYNVLLNALSEGVDKLKDPSGENTLFIEGEQIASKSKNNILPVYISDDASHANKFGTHQVIQYKNVHYKHSPYATGIEYTVNSLNKILCEDIALPIKLLKLQGKEGEVALYQASSSINEALNLQTFLNSEEGRARLEHLDLPSFSALIISSLLTGSGDAKPDNFMVRSDGDKLKLISIDNDISFCKGRLGFKKLATGKGLLYSDVLNVLYFFSQMDLEVDPLVKSQLTEHSSEYIISTWLKDIYEQNQRYISITKYGFTNEDLEILKLPILLPKNSVKEMYFRLKTLEKMCKTNEIITHSDMFKAFYPGLGQYYEIMRIKNNFALNGIRKMYEDSTDDRDIAKDLAAQDKLISHKAWHKASSSTMLTSQKFNEIFSASVESHASDFLKNIDFSTLDDSNSFLYVVLGKNLAFLEEFILTKINERQLNSMFSHILDSNNNEIHIRNIHIYGWSESKCRALQDSKIIQDIKSLGINVELEAYINLNNEEEDEGLIRFNNIKDDGKIILNLEDELDNLISEYTKDLPNKIKIAMNT